MTSYLSFFFLLVLNSNKEAGFTNQKYCLYSADVFLSFSTCQSKQRMTDQIKRIFLVSSKKNTKNADYAFETKFSDFQFHT